MKRHTVLLSFLTLIGFFFITSLNSYAQAQTVYGCAKKKGGYLRVVTEPSLCKSNETSITMNQGGTDTGESKVYDAAGQYLGILQDATESLRVYIPSLNVYANVGNEDIGYDCTYYANSDCTGQAYSSLYFPNSSLRLFEGIGKKYYVHDGSAIGGYSTQSYSCGAICTVDSYNFIGMKLKEITVPFQVPINLPISINPEVIPSHPRLTIEPLNASIQDPHIGSNVSFSIIGGTPPFNAYSNNPTVLDTLVSGNLLTVSILKFPESFQNTFKILVTDSAGVSIFGSLQILYSPIQITPGLYSIGNPSIGSIATFSVSGGNEANYNLWYSNTDYISASLSGSTITVNLLAVPSSDLTIVFQVSDGTGNYASASLILDVP